MANKSGIHKPQSRYGKIGSLPGFKYLVNRARTSLGLDKESVQEKGMDSPWGGRYMQAVWTIMDIFQVTDQSFVMNAVALGIDEALTTKVAPPVTILVPEIPRELGFSLAVEIAHKLWPKPGEGYWLQSTEDGKPSGISVPWQELNHQGVRPRASVVRGPGVISLITRNGPRMYMDVTDASKTDIERAIPEVRRLRKALSIVSPTVKGGAPATMDEEKAVEAALCHRRGTSYVKIGEKFGWPISYLYEHVKFGNCPTAVRYVRLGEEILKRADHLAQAIREGIP